MDEKRRMRKTTRMTTEVTSFDPAAGRVALRGRDGSSGVPARRRRQHCEDSQNGRRQGAQLCVRHSLRAARTPSPLLGSLRGNGGVLSNEIRV